MTTTTAPPRRVLVGVDFGDHGDLALRTALALATAAGDTEVHAVHVAPRRDSAAGSQRVLDRFGADIDRLRASVAAAVEGHLKQYGKPPSAHVVVHRASGSPAAEIARMARALEVGVVVVGTHTNNGVRRALLGSVAERLVRILTCPVLVVRPVAHHGDARDLGDDVEPLCEACAARRAETNGEALWCSHHAEHHTFADAYRGSSSGSIRPSGFA